MNCMNCVFWEPFSALLPDGTLNGLCRRFPPVPVIDQKSDKPKYLLPHTRQDDWCGEGLPRE